MASQDSSNAFEALIHADRARKKNEDLANQIFGRTKSSQSVKKTAKEPRSPSLASRMGIQKRTSSSTTPTQKNPFNPPSRPSSTTPSHASRDRDRQSSNARASRIASEIDSGNANVTTSRNNSFTTTTPSSTSRNGTTSKTQPSGPGLTIRGTAGPFTVRASNFAPGTTEADIEAALQSDLFDDNGQNCLQKCSLVSAKPSVVVEMLISERVVAERIVEKFDGLKADGRILSVEIVKSGRTGGGADRRKENGTGVKQSIEQPLEAAGKGPGAIEDVPVAVAETGDMEMDDVVVAPDYQPASSYDHEREAADRDRRDRDRNRDRDDYAPGRRDDRDRPRDDRDRRRDDREDDRDRDRDRDQDRDRDRDRDRPRDDRDRDYDRRDSQMGSMSQSQPQGYSRGGPPPQPAYGNGYNRPPRGGGGYGGYTPRGSYGYGRGSYGPPRGGGGGGYRGYGR